MKTIRTPKINLPSDLTTLLRLLVVPAVAILVFVGSAWAAEEKVALEMELPPPDVPQPQLFCGYCHVLTYPGVVQKGYELWQKDKHNKIGCVECHYPPGASASRTPTNTAVSVTKASHIPAKPPGHFPTCRWVAIPLERDHKLPMPAVRPPLVTANRTISSKPKKSSSPTKSLLFTNRIWIKRNRSKASRSTASPATSTLPIKRNSR